MRFKNESVDENFDKSDSYRDWIQKSVRFLHIHHCLITKRIEIYSIF